MSEPVDFVAKLNKLRAEKNQAAFVPPTSPATPPAPAWQDDALLPELGGNIPEHERELDAFVNNIDIIDGYIKWCGKMVPDSGGKRESIMISCPKPEHRDAKPSAWINLDKQTWFCGGCQEGGDVHDIAAYNMNLPVPGYKQGETFRKLRRDMAESFGFRMKEVAGGTVTWVESQNATPPQPPQPPVPPVPSVVQTPEPPVPAQVAPVGGSADEAPIDDNTPTDNISHMWADESDSEEADLVTYPTIDWRNIVPENTFLRAFMEATTNDDAPEEYHFWHGLMALGLVVGRNVTLDDTLPVYGNLMVCILGATGTGKSRSRRHLSHVLKDVSPYSEDGTQTTGVKLVPTPSSGEYLVSQFSYEGRDPANGKTSLGYKRVVGTVDFDELAALLARAQRQGSTMTPTLMQLADATPEVKIGGLQRGDFIAHEPFCSVTASTQPKSIRNLLSRNDAGSGFLNRWVFAGGRVKQIEAVGGARSVIRVDLTEAIQELKYVRGWGAVERSITMDDDAYELYLKFFRAKIEPAKLNDPTDLLKRIDLLSKKLMLLFTINMRRNSVPIEAVQSMMALHDYIVECFGILNSNIGITQMQDVMSDIERHIRRHLEKTGRGASARDIARYTHRKNYGLEQIKKALDVMTALDLIELAPKEAGVSGRPTVRYKAVGDA